MSFHPSKANKKTGVPGVAMQPGNPNDRIRSTQSGHKKLHQGTAFHQVQRPWPTWRESEDGSVDAKMKQEETKTPAEGMTPMERWRKECQGDAHWHGIQSFQVMSEGSRMLESGSQKQRGSTDDGVWIVDTSCLGRAKI